MIVCLVHDKPFCWVFGDFFELTALSQNPCASEQRYYIHSVQQHLGKIKQRFSAVVVVVGGTSEVNGNPGSRLLCLDG